MSILRIIGVVIGLLLLVVAGGGALGTFIANSSMSDEGQVLGTIFLTGLAVLGFFLVRRSSPAFFGGVGAWPARFVRWLLQPSSVWHPVGLAVWTLVIVASQGDPDLFVLSSVIERDAALKDVLK